MNSRYGLTGNQPDGYLGLFPRTRVQIGLTTGRRLLRWNSGAEGVSARRQFLVAERSVEPGYAGMDGPAPLPRATSARNARPLWLITWPLIVPLMAVCAMPGVD